MRVQNYFDVSKAGKFVHTLVLANFKVRKFSFWPIIKGQNFKCGKNCPAILWFPERMFRFEALYLSCRGDLTYSKAARKVLFWAPVVVLLLRGMVWQWLWEYVAQPTAPDSEIYDIWLPLNWMSFFSVTARFFVALCFKDTNCEMSSLGIFIHKCKFPRQKCTDMQLNNNSNRQSKNLTYVFIYKPSFQKIRSNYVGRFDTHKYCYQTNSKKSSSHESARKESFYLEIHFFYQFVLYYRINT